VVLFPVLMYDVFERGNNAVLRTGCGGRKKFWQVLQEELEIQLLASLRESWQIKLPGELLVISY
jgi:hypothetical protein